MKGSYVLIQVLSANTSPFLTEINCVNLLAFFVFKLISLSTLFTLFSLLLFSSLLQTFFLLFISRFPHFYFFLLF